MGPLPVTSRVITKFLFFFGPQNSIYGGGPPVFGAPASLFILGAGFTFLTFSGRRFSRVRGLQPKAGVQPRYGNPLVWAVGPAEVQAFDASFFYCLLSCKHSKGRFLSLSENWIWRLMPRGLHISCTYPIELPFLKLRASLIQSIKGWSCMNLRSLVVPLPRMPTKNPRRLKFECYAVHAACGCERI